jgi:hypothetical protein
MNFYEVKSKEKNSIFKPPNKIQFQVAADNLVRPKFLEKTSEQENVPTCHSNQRRKDWRG